MLSNIADCGVAAGEKIAVTMKILQKFVKKDNNNPISFKNLYHKQINNKKVSMPKT